jgi:hypothetical protein
MKASQGEDKTYRYLVCRIEYPMLDFDKCPLELSVLAGERNKSSCIDCENVEDCSLLRARYERKKRAIQLSRYAQDEEKAKVRESKDLTDEQLLNMIEKYLHECMDGERISATKLRAKFHLKLGIKIGHNKAYSLKTLIEMKENGKASQ